MPLQADVPTLIASLVLASLCVGLVMAVMGWGAPHEGLSLWAGAMALHAAALHFLDLHGRVDATASFLLGSGLSAFSLSMVFAAVQRFYGARQHWPALVIPPLLMVLLWFSLPSHPDLRAPVAHGILALQTAAVVLALFLRRATTLGRAKWLVMVGFSTQVLALAWLAGAGLRGATHLFDLFPLAPLHAAALMHASAVVLVTSLGFAFMTKERRADGNRVLSTADGLTGVAHRRSIIAALDRDVARAIRTRESLALMMIDLDHFRNINDTHGQRAGDAVLQRVAQLVAQRIRSQDIVGRYGGEEFLVVLPDTTLAGVLQLGQDLCAAVAQEPFHFHGQAVPLTISVGVCGGRLEPGDSWDLLIHGADSALARAKRDGRNRVEASSFLEPLRRTSEVAAGVETFPPTLG